MLACQGALAKCWDKGSSSVGTRALEETPAMVRSAVHKGECYNISINVLLPGAGGPKATCRECAELLELGTAPTTRFAGFARR
jgi:hypothetical protein